MPKTFPTFHELEILTPRNCAWLGKNMSVKAKNLIVRFVLEYRSTRYLLVSQRIMGALVWKDLETTKRIALIAFHQNHDTEFLFLWWVSVLFKCILRTCWKAFRPSKLHATVAFFA